MIWEKNFDFKIKTKIKNLKKIELSLKIKELLRQIKEILENNEIDVNKINETNNNENIDKI